MSQKTVQERLDEVSPMYQRLASFGIHRSTTPELNEFYQLANAFVRDGSSASGVIKLSQIDRRLAYQFSNTRGRPSTAIIQYTGKPDPKRKR